MPELPVITVDRVGLSTRGVGYRDERGHIYVLVPDGNSFEIYFGDRARLVRQSSLQFGTRSGQLASIYLRAPRSSRGEATLELDPPPPAPLALVCGRGDKLRMDPLPGEATKRIVASATFHSPRVPSPVVFFGRMSNGVFLLIEDGESDSDRRVFLGPKGELRPVSFLGEHREVVMLGGKDVGKVIVRTSAGQFTEIDQQRTWTPSDGAPTPIERMAGEQLDLRFAEPAVYGRMGYVCDE